MYDPQLDLLRLSTNGHTTVSSCDEHAKPLCCRKVRLRWHRRATPTLDIFELTVHGKPINVRVRSASEQGHAQETSVIMDNDAAITRDNVALFILQDPTDYETFIVCVDIAEHQIIGVTPIDLPPKSHLEIYAFAVSNGGKFMALATGITTKKLGTRSQVRIWDTRFGREMFTMDTRNDICPTVAFNPKRPESEVTILARHLRSVSNVPVVGRYDLSTGKELFKKSVQILMPKDEDEELGDPLIGLKYTLDGEFLIVKKMDQLWYGSEMSAELFVLQSDSFCLVRKYRPIEVTVCHLKCACNTAIWLSACNSKCVLQVPSSSSKKKEEESEVFSLPLKAELKNMARVAVVSNMKSGVGIPELPVPDHVKSYLMFH